MTQKPYASLLRAKCFVVESDHRNLMWLSKADLDKDPKLARWRMIMLQYQFTIQHIPGVQNNVADMLSRVGHPPADSAANDVLVDEVLQDDIMQRIKTAQADASAHDAEWFKKYDLVLNQGLYVTRDGNLCLPDNAEGLKNDILKCVHGTYLTGHVGQARTRDNLRDAHITWSKVHEYVKKFVESCASCQKVRLRRHVAVLMKSISVYAVFEALSIDALGPFVSDSKGNRYVIVIIDMFSRWIELFAVPTTDAASAAEAILQTVFARHGLPRTIMSDNGPQFANAVIASLMEKLQVRHHRVIPYHPQSNGEVERSNQEILRHLRCFLIGCTFGKEWSSMLCIVQFLLNNSICSSTGYTPHSLIYGGQFATVKDLVEVPFPVPLIIEEDGEAVTYTHVHATANEAFG